MGFFDIQIKLSLFLGIFAFQQISGDALEPKVVDSIESYKTYADQEMRYWEEHIQTANSFFNVDELNAYPHADTLIPAEVEDFDDFINSSNYSLYRTQADQLIAQGELVKIFYFSGLKPVHGKTRYSYVPEKDVSTNSAGVMPIPLGIRYILQYRQQLEKLAIENGKNSEEYLKKAKLILQVDDIDLESIEKDLNEFEWFNFSPENIVILVQPAKHTYRLVGKKFIPENSIKRLGGHGYATAQVVHSKLGQCYTFSIEGKRIPLSVSASSYMREKGGRWLLTASVTDLMQMTHLSLDPDRLAMVLYLCKQGHNMVIEVLKNPDRRIGAYWAQSGQDHPLVVHTLELLSGSPGAKRPLDYLMDENAFYSRFIHYIKLETLEEVLSQTNLPLYVEPDDMTSTYRLISFSHDICRIPGINTAAFHQEGQIMHGFRQEEEIPEVLAFMSRQDTDLYFKSGVKEVYLKRIGKYLNEPLHFHSNYVKQPWGGTHIVDFKDIPSITEGKIGEGWEISSRPRQPSYLILGEQIQPLTLEDLMNNDEVAKKIVGPRVFCIAKNWFPILYKFVDAKEVLSVKVHPSTKLAEELGEGEPGKSETWVILNAKPNAHFYLGLKSSTSYDKLLEAINNNEDLLPLMKRYKVKAGDVLTTVPGIVHAVGAGIFTAAIQVNSDISYRLYDHKRYPTRPVHLPQALRAINMDLQRNYEHKPRVQPKMEQQTTFGSQVELVAENPYFEVRRARIKLHDNVTIDSKGDFQIVSVVHGRIKLCTNTSKTLLRQGQTVLLTALSNPVVLITNDYEAQVLLIRPGKNPQPIPAPKPVKFVESSNIVGSINLALSFVGPKLVLGALSSEGLIATSPQIEWKKQLETKGEYTAEDFIELIVDELEKIVNTLEKKGVDRTKIREVGIAWPGPGDYAKGVVSATFVPGFYKYPLSAKLKERLEERLNLRVSANVILDAWAGVYGEMTQDSTLKNWIYLNIDTGIAMGIVKDGKILNAYHWPEKDSVQSGLGHIGRHIIHCADGRYEYRPTQNGEISPMVDGEIRLTDWVGAPALAKRFVDHVLMRAETTSVVPSDFFGTSIKKLKIALMRKDPTATQTVLSAVQERAKEKNEIAIEMISEVGRDIGSALRTFADAFPQEFFYNRIIIGGEVGENLGKDIPAPNNSDILLHHIIQFSQIPNIRRTKMDIRRELLAFKPVNPHHIPELLVFDLDNTLYDASQLIKLCKKAMYEFYRSKHNLSIEEAGLIVENKRRELACSDQMTGNRNVMEALGFTFEEFLAFKDHYIGDPGYYIESTCGLREQLVELKKHYRLVLVTDRVKKTTVSILKKLEIYDLFEKIYTQDEIRLHKSDSLLFEFIQSEMKVPFDRMVSIGYRDEADIQPVKRLGMQVLSVKNVTDLLTKIRPTFLNQLELTQDEASEKS